MFKHQISEDKKLRDFETLKSQHLIEFESNLLAQWRIICEHAAEQPSNRICLYLYKPSDRSAEARIHVPLAVPHHVPPGSFAASRELPRAAYFGRYDSRGRGHLSGNQPTYPSFSFDFCKFNISTVSELHWKFLRDTIISPHSGNPQVGVAVRIH